MDAWIDAAGIAADKKGPLFRTIRKGNKLTENPMARSDVLVMIKRRAEAAALPYFTCCHTFHDLHAKRRHARTRAADRCARIAAHHEAVRSYRRPKFAR
jgi:hypothetical protein